MAKLALIGDVHGKLEQYLDITKKCPKTIQLGDFGFSKQHLWHIANVNPDNHKICFGNHDDTTFLDSKHSLGNFSYIKDYDIFSIRGAFTIDGYRRTLGISIFDNEQLSYVQMLDCISLYESIKPKIVISHDAPQFIRSDVFDIYESSSTSKFLEQLFEIHRPEMWIFGHHHKRIDVNVLGTRFICLEELGIFELDIP